MDSSLCCPEWPQTPELKWSSSESLSSHGSQTQVYAAIPWLLLRPFGFLFLKHGLNTGSWWGFLCPAPMYLRLALNSISPCLVYWEEKQATPTMPCFFIHFSQVTLLVFASSKSVPLCLEPNWKKKNFTKYWSSFLSLPFTYLPSETSGYKWRTFCCRVRLLPASVEWISQITDCSVSIL